MSAMDNFEEAKDYMSKREIPQLFESLMTGLMYNKPSDHIKFLEDCLSKAKAEDKIQWNSFLGPLPPIPQHDRPIQSENATDDVSNNNIAKPVAAQEIAGLSKEHQPLPPIRKTPSRGKSASSVGRKSTSPTEESRENGDSRPQSTIRGSEMLKNDIDGITNEEVAPEVTTEDGTIEIGNTDKVEQLEATSKEDKVIPTIVFVLGGPGSGKGTQCAKIVDQFGFVHLSAGDLLRHEMNKEGSEYKDLIDECIKEGKLVPQEITIQLLRNAIFENLEAKGFLVDGFPRDIEQGVEFETRVCKSAALLMFSCDDSVLVERLLERSKTSGRSDDNEDTIRLRLQTFHEKTVPVALHYKDKLTEIDASRSVEEIYKGVEAFMEKLISVEELSAQIDDIVEQLEENPIDTGDQEEASPTAPTPTQYPQTEDEIVPVDAAICGEKGFVTEEIVAESAQSTKDQEEVKKEDEIIPVIDSGTGDIGNTSDILKDFSDGKKVVFILGPPNAGKTTQCLKLADTYGYRHIPLDILAEGTEQRQKNPINIIKNAIIDADSSVHGFLVEGFPRDFTEAQDFDSEVGECSLVVVLNCTNEEIIARKQQTIPNDSSLSESSDFLLTLEKGRAAVMAHYESQGKVVVISASGTEEEVYQEIVNIFKDRLKEPVSATMSKELENANIIFVLGGPGSGKGTQCAKIVEKYGFCHLSTGDLLREEVGSGSERAKKLKDIMERGELVSQEIILELLKDAMIKRKDCKGFLIDGFPRDVPQGNLFEKTVGTCKFVLYFDCSNEVMVERLLGRAKTSGRVDDNEETIKKRLKTFQDQTLPVLEKYGPQNKVRKINAERDVDAIFMDVCSVVDKM